jgi:diaminopimelate epimerase
MLQKTNLSPAKSGASVPAHAEKARPPASANRQSASLRQDRPFLKMHGLGNDFVVIDARKAPLSLTKAQIERLADRRFGIGCDQLILIEASTIADARMRIFNPDGDEVGACGNATRCIAWLLSEELGRLDITIETLAGFLKARRLGDEIAVDMGVPKLDWPSIPLQGSPDEAANDTARVAFEAGAIDPALPNWFSAVNMGNPHAVFFVDDVMGFDLLRIGPLLENHPLFPQKANISLVEVAGRHMLTQRVWERGAGITLACGTAACAASVAARRLGFCEGEIAITLPGGTLYLDESASRHVIMRGPVASSFSGVINPALMAVEV